MLKASDNAKVPLFDNDNIEKIRKCKNFEQLFDIINHHLSWDEYFILNHIIDLCKSEEAKEEFTRYKRKTAVSQGLHIISSTTAKRGPPPGFEKFCVILDEPYRNLSIEQYEEIKAFIFKNLDVHRYITTGYIRVLFGSVGLEWHVTTQAVPHMIEMAYRKRALFIENFYVFMQIGEEVIIKCTPVSSSESHMYRKDSDFWYSYIVHLVLPS